jgi:hypothetical protein
METWQSTWFETRVKTAVETGESGSDGFLLSVIDR